MGLEFTGLYSVDYVQEAGGVLEKLESEVAEQQKTSIKAQGDCRSFNDALKSTRDELKRLEKQTTSVIIRHYRS